MRGSKEAGLGDEAVEVGEVGLLRGISVGGEQEEKGKGGYEG